MKINIHTDGVIITAKQKALMEKKLSKMKRYLPAEEPVTIDLLLKDDTSIEKGGVDQRVHLNVTFGKEQIFIEEIDDRLMRAFAYAASRLERQLSRFHRKRVGEKKRGGGGRFDKLLKVIKRRK